jgi:hypothetical protein
MIISDECEGDTLTNVWEVIPEAQIKMCNSKSEQAG